MNSYNEFKIAFDSLNPQQKFAVESIEGPVLVLAGPGTGKTQVLTLRVGCILERTDVNPSNILVLTFTDNAVKMCHKRLYQLIGKASYSVNVMTYHSFCSMVVEENPEKFSFKKELSLITDVKKFNLIRDILSKNRFEYIANYKKSFLNAKKILQDIQNLKKEGISHKQMIDYIKNEMSQMQEFLLNDKRSVKELEKISKIRALEELSKVYVEYQAKLKEESLYDFDDMMLFVVNRLKKDNNLLLNYQERFQYFLIDEFQDSNTVQVDLAYRLASYDDSPNLFIVGDDDQSIYRFQGASLKNFDDFLGKYPNAKRITLSDNYRSSQLILDASRSVIVNNEDRIDPTKHLIAKQNYVNHKVDFVTFNSDIEELNFLKERVLKLLKQGVVPGEIAILTRTNNQSHVIIDFFKKHGIAYHSDATTPFIQNHFVKKLILILKIVNNPTDLNSFLEFLFLDSLNLSVNEISAIGKFIQTTKNRSDINLVTIFEIDKKYLSDKVQTVVDIFSKLYAKKDSLIVYDFLLDVLHRFNLLSTVLNAPNSLEHTEAVFDFLNFVKTDLVNEEASSIEYLLNLIEAVCEHSISLKRASTYMVDSSCVNIMTVHKSKGLEFEYVLIPFATDAVWGKSSKTNSTYIPPELINEKVPTEVQLSESRRLFYVAMTRAKYQIIISYSEKMLSSTTAQEPSRFIGEISAELKNSIGFPLQTIDKSLSLIAQQVSSQFYDKINKLQLIRILNSQFRMSPTAFNQYLKCKRAFFVSSLLKLPSVENIQMMRGIILHQLLEKFLLTPENEQGIKESIDRYLRFKNLKQNEKESLATECINDFQDIIEAWRFGQRIPKPYNVELNLKSFNLSYKNVPLTGKIDVVEKLKDSVYRVIDYKASKTVSLKNITGVNKTNRLDYYYQLMFYKLMLEEKDNGRSHVNSGTIYFLNKNEKDQFGIVDVEFNQKDYADFLNLLTQVYDEIMNLKFLDFTEKCQCSFDGSCYYEFLRK